MYKSRFCGQNIGVKAKNPLFTKQKGENIMDKNKNKPANQNNYNANNKNNAENNKKSKVDPMEPHA